MSDKVKIEFKSKECKHDNHINCVRLWTGLGFTVLCNCMCHEDSPEKDASSDRGDPASISGHTLRIRKVYDRK